MKVLPDRLSVETSATMSSTVTAWPTYEAASAALIVSAMEGGTVAANSDNARNTGAMSFFMFLSIHSGHVDYGTS